MHFPSRTLLALVLAAPVVGRQLPSAPPPRRNPADLPLSSNLYDVWLDRDLPLAEQRRRAVPGFVDVDDARRVLVEIVGPPGSSAVPDPLIRRFGGVAQTRWRNRVKARIPARRLVDLARALPPGHRVQRAARPFATDVAGEGPAVTGSAAWRDGGADGAGLTVGVIDSDFAGLDAAASNGDLGAWTAVNYTGDPLQDSSVHGTACAETVHDHAPGAEYRLYKVESETDLGAAVQDCIDNGVDVISHSLSWTGQFWFDDEGAAAEAADHAGDSGILFFTSAGNSAESHWQGTFSPASPGSDWHGWSGGDGLLELEVLPQETVTITLTWDDSWSGTDDYDLFVFDESGQNLIDSSTNPNEWFEAVALVNPSMTDTALVNLAVWLDDGPGAEFELFSDGDGDWEYSVAASSTASPSNSTNKYVISVGAVRHDDYASPPGTGGIVTDYSSRGPTNGGAPRPAVVSPTNTATFSYGGPFSGTSSSAPNAAGMTLCLWSSVLPYHRNAVRWLVLRQGSVFRDWGPGGQENVYGHGGVNLIDFAPKTRWLTDEYGNPNGYPDHPANTLADALAQTPAGGRIVAFPGGSFPAPAVLDKPVSVVSRGGGAVLGD